MNKASKNMVISMISKLLVLIFGVISQKYVLVSFGSAINGLTSSINQFMIYFVLLEAGLGTASIQALYEPLANHDNNKINGIINATQKQYTLTGIIFFVLWLLMSLIMPLIVKLDGNQLEYEFIFWVTLLSGMGSIINYLFIGRFIVLLRADNKIYILNILDTIFSIISNTLKIILINLGFDIILVLLCSSVVILLKLLYLYFYVKKNYKYLDKNVQADFKATKKRWNVFIHQIVGAINIHSDMILVTILDTLQLVSVYSVYNYVFSNINTIINITFLQAPMATFGKIYVQKKQLLKVLYSRYEFFYNIILHIVLISSLLLIIPFIKLYTVGVDDINYVNYWTAFLFVISQYLNLIRIPSLMMVNISGHFRETQKGAIIEMGLNVTCSIVLFSYLGINGLLLGTIIGLLYRTFDIIIYVYQNILYISLKKYIFMVLKNLIVGIIAVLLYKNIFTPNINSWREWIIWAMFTFVYILFIYIMVLLVFNFKNILSLKRNRAWYKLIKK